MPKKQDISDEINSLDNQYITQSELDNISKFILDPREQTIEVEPNAMTLGGLPEIGLKRLKPVAIPKWLLSHPAVERGIEFKFNRMIRQLDKNNIGNNIIPRDTSKLANDAFEYCLDILNNSHNQPVSWIKQFGRDAMRFGDNYALLVKNKAKDTVLRWELQNPIFFSPNYEKIGSDTSNSSTPLFNFAIRGQDNVKYIIDPRTKRPKEYTQLKKIGSSYSSPSATADPNSINFEPFGKPFPANQVIQLNFDRIGDEPFGIPIAQTLWNVVELIMKVEDAGAETMVAFGYNSWLAHTPFRTKEKMQTFAKSIENISKRSIIVLPEGVKVDNVKPGSTEFEKVHNILLSVIAMRLGISRVQLVGDGADINKSTLSSLMSDVRSDFFADELELESSLNEGFIKSCILKYRLNTPEKLKTFPFPRFGFSEMEEDKGDKAEMELKQSLSLRNLSYSIDLLKANGYDEQATTILNNWLNTLIPKVRTQIDFIGNNNKRKAE